jgi:hypothetical protein
VELDILIGVIEFVAVRIWSLDADCRSESLNLGHIAVRMFQGLQLMKESM